MIENINPEYLKRISCYNLNNNINLSIIEDLISTSLIQRVIINNEFIALAINKASENNLLKKNIIFNNYALLDIKKKYSDKDIKYLFIYNFGSYIFWNFEEAEELEILEQIITLTGNNLLLLQNNKTFVLSYIEHEVVEREDYIIKNYISDDNIYLKSSDILEKISSSYALAYSIKLKSIESEINTITKTIESNTKFDFFKLMLNYSKKEYYQNIARIFLIESEINCDINFVSEPRYIFENDDFYNEYFKVHNYYQIATRTENLNNKLESIKEINYEIKQENIKKEWKNIYYGFILWLSIIILINIQINIKKIFN